MAAAAEVVYQSTDLARRHRDVLDAARRPGGALIRDKDGEALLLAAAGPLLRERYVLDGLQAAVQVLAALQVDDPADPLRYGPLGWLAVLPRPDQAEFVWQYVRALRAVEATGTDAVEQLLYEWRQTARAWADPQLRRDLTADLDEPLHDVAL